MFGDGPNCEFWRFIIGLDEMAMSCEVGLYLDFGVRDGAPTASRPALGRKPKSRPSVPSSTSAAPSENVSESSSGLDKLKQTNGPKNQTQQTNSRPVRSTRNKNPSYVD